METEKRIGDFRVNRKVSWGITLPQNLHTGSLIQISPFWGPPAGFVHSLGVEFGTPPAQLPDPVGQPRHGIGVLVAKPAIRQRRGPRPALRRSEPVVRVDHDPFHLL